MIRLLILSSIALLAIAAAAPDPHVSAVMTCHALTIVRYPGCDDCVGSYIVTANDGGGLTGPLELVEVTGARSVFRAANWYASPGRTYTLAEIVILSASSGYETYHPAESVVTCRVVYMPVVTR